MLRMTFLLNRLFHHECLIQTQLKRYRSFVPYTNKFNRKFKKKLADIDRIISPRTVQKLKPSENFKGRHVSESTRRWAEQNSRVLTDHIRQAFLYGLLDKKLTRRVEITKAAVSPDLSVLQIYWIPISGEENSNDLVSCLMQYSDDVKQYLQECRVIGKIPPIIFKQDFKSKNVRIVEKTLNDSDFIPDAERSKSFENLELKCQLDSEVDDDSVSDVTSYTENKFADLMNRFRQDICNVERDVLMEKIRSKINRAQTWRESSKDVTDLDHELLIKKIDSAKRTLKRKEKFPSDTFQPPLILSEEARRNVIDEYSDLAKSIHSKRQIAKKQKHKRRTATYDDLLKDR